MDRLENAALALGVFLIFVRGCSGQRHGNSFSGFGFDCVQECPKLEWVGLRGFILSYTVIAEL
jgi:hypothetical protein